MDTLEADTRGTTLDHILPSPRRVVQLLSILATNPQSAAVCGHFYAIPEPQIDQSPESRRRCVGVPLPGSRRVYFDRRPDISHESSPNLLYPLPSGCPEMQNTHLTSSDGGTFCSVMCRLYRPAELRKWFCDLHGRNNVTRLPQWTYIPLHSAQAVPQPNAIS